MDYQPRCCNVPAKRLGYGRQRRDSSIRRPRPNNSFKPTPLRYANYMADQACHMVNYAYAARLNSGVRHQIMYVENVEIFSGQSNSPVIRCPGRRFPGVLVQGDTLHMLCAHAAEALSDSPEARIALQELHTKLLGMLAHYKTVLHEHRVPLPFTVTPDA